MKRVNLVLTVATMVLVSTAALARPGQGGGPGGGPGWGHAGPGGPGFALCRALKAPEVGVTDEQAARLRPLCKAQRQRTDELFEGLDDLRDAARVELEKDQPDLDRVGALHQQMATLHTELARQHVSLRDAARGILTAEQLATLKRLHDERGPKQGLHRGGPGRGPGGADCPLGGPDGAPDPRDDAAE